MAHALQPITATLFLTADLAALPQAHLRIKLREAADCGIRTLIPTLAAEHGRAYLPSSICDRVTESTFSYTARRRGQPVAMQQDDDPFAVMLDEAAALGMDVFMPTGTFSPRKPGSSMMWPYPATEWFTPDVAERNRAFIFELADRYGQSPAFAGWYLSDEMKWAIDEHELLVGTLAAACRDALPGKSILMSPSAAHAKPVNRYLTDPAAVSKLHADIICPMDCSSYTHRGDAPFTDAMWQDIETSTSQAAAACAAAGKRFWSNIEMFFYDHDRTANYPHTAAWPRIERQIAIASNHAARLCCFQFFTLLDAPNSTVPLGEEHAAVLYEALQSHNRRANATISHDPRA